MRLSYVRDYGSDLSVDITRDSSKTDRFKMNKTRSAFRPSRNQQEVTFTTVNTTIIACCYYCYRHHRLHIDMIFSKYTLYYLLARVIFY